MIDIFDSFLLGILVVGMIFLLSMAIAMTCEVSSRVICRFLMGKIRYGLIVRLLLIPGFIIGCTALGWFAKALTP